ncbi:MAG TPA: hypothetical protein PK402_05030, partial [Tepidisphaeraceae bacterium]|nr:hypothetical protein [Tepidisphaeraceae bacterium]
MSETLGRAEASVQVDLIVKPRTLSRRYRVVALALLRRQSARNRLWQVGGLVARQADLFVDRLA